VEESDASWCSSNSANDNRAITIEVASDLTEPYKITTAAYKSLVRLLVDICKRNGISELKWCGDKSLIGKIDKQNMTVHRWFANKSCPGDYLYDLHDQIAKEVNSQLLKTTYRVLIGDFSSLEDAEIAVRNAKAKGVLTHLIQSSDSVILEPVDEIAKEVIRGLWGNGAARKRRLTQAGYDYVVIQERVRELLD
jgi:hypothetical protein